MRRKTRGWTAAGVLLAGTVTGVALYLAQEPASPVLQPVAVPADVPDSPPPRAESAEPAIRYPLKEEADASALPALNESDSDVWKALAAMLGERGIKALLRPEDIVRHIVVTVDNLPRKTLAARLLPTKPAEGTFRTTGTGDELAIAPGNAERYTPYVRLADKFDAKKLVALYIHFYPLFQHAYREQGYPNAYFNDRLVAVIDHLLAAPEPEAPVQLTQPHVLYKFADPELEASSAGHKIMMRMGAENAAKIKSKLRQIRAELTSKETLKETESTQ